MKEESNVVKFKKRRNINIGVILFIIILAYTILNIYLYVTKPQISIYEVVEQSLAKDTVVKGIITRQETIVTTTTSGYVNYYFRDGAKIAKNSTVYSIDESKRIYEKLADLSGNITYTDREIIEIKRNIKKYRQTISTDNFSIASTFKEELTADLREIIDDHLLDNMQTIVNDTGIASNFSVVKTNQPGIISYYSDNYDGLQESGITSAIFDMDKYQRKKLRSSDVLETGAPVYKLFTSNYWTITSLISEELALELQPKTQLSFTIESNQLKVKAPISIYQSGNEWYLKITMDKYLVNYSKERFLSLQLDLNHVTGLKIPKTAITEKQFYMIPNEYFTNGGNTTDMGLMLITYDNEKGETMPVFTACEVYYKDDSFSYVDMETFPAGSIIQNMENAEKFQINMTGKLEGVYNVNKGYAVFRRIERISENNEYVIVQKGTSKGISLYDHLALNAETATDSSVIY